MKILGVPGSPRIQGNSDILLDEALRGAKDCGAGTEKVVRVRKRIAGCLDCKKCNRTGVCAIRDDMQGILGKIVAADAILHGCPVYFWALFGSRLTVCDEPPYTGPRTGGAGFSAGFR